MNYYQKIFDLLTEGSLGLQRGKRIEKARIRASKKGKIIKLSKLQKQAKKIEIRNKEESK